MAVEMLFEPGRIGPITVKNRFVRAATSETMSQPSGAITDAYRTLYRDLARGGAGLILTGHMFVHPRGRYFHRQAGIHSDSLVPSLRQFTSMIHDEGGTIFAELGHAGSQCRDPDVTPMAPSPVENFVSARAPASATEAEIEEAIASFGQGARRAREAGFDGVHIHAGHGYLISEFSSPHGNRRDDDWGGDAARRSRFVLAVYGAVRAAVGPDFPVTVKLGMADSMEEGGLQLEESLDRAVALEDAGVDAIEVSVGIMHLLTKSAGEFVGVTAKRAFQDLVAHRLFYPAVPEGLLPAGGAGREAATETRAADSGRRYPHHRHHGPDTGRGRGGLHLDGPAVHPRARPAEQDHRGQARARRLRLLQRLHGARGPRSPAVLAHRQVDAAQAPAVSSARRRALNGVSRGSSPE